MLGKVSKGSRLLVHRPGTSKERIITKKVRHARPDLFVMLTWSAVERRRREVINEGIENLAKMIPTNSDKNKGAILTGAIKYITDLQQRIQSFDNERSVFEITQQELTRRNESLRDSAQRAWAETAKWMGRSKEAGLQFDDYDAGVEVQEMEDHSSTNIPGNENSGFGAGNVDKADSTMA